MTLAVATQVVVFDHRHFPGCDTRVFVCLKCVGGRMCAALWSRWVLSIMNHRPNKTDYVDD